MTQKFTTPCFIRKNTPGLRKKLEELGYYPHPSEKKFYEDYPNYVGSSLHTGRGFYAIMPIGYDEELAFEVYCGLNEVRFLALAALRSDTDKGQWFCDKNGLWELTFDDFPSRYMQMHGHKATVGEIMEQFSIEL